MEKIEVYVHGVPYGQDIWGATADRDYIQTFYSHDANVTESVLFRIEMMRNKTFYSYLKYKDVNNSEGRTGSYFGLTIGFCGSYCTNTSLLYKVFNAVYEQVCLNKILKKEGAVTRYIVSSFEQKTDIMNSIRIAFEQQFEKLLASHLSPLDNSFKQNGLVKFAITEVDSPYFIENLKAHKVLVSPDYPSFEAINRQLKAQVTPLNERISDLNAQVSDWKTKKEQLDLRLSDMIQKNTSLQSKIDSLSKDLENAEREISKKYQSSVEQLKNQLKDLQKQQQTAQSTISQLRVEKDMAASEVSRLKKELDKAGSSKDLKDSINTIAPSIKQLARQMASQFPDADEPDISKGMVPNDEDKQVNHQSTTSKDWTVWVNYILFAVVIALLVWIKIPSVIGIPNTEENHSVNAEVEKLKAKNQELQNKVEELTRIKPQPYDYGNDLKINLVGGQSTMKINQSCSPQLIGNRGVIDDAPGHWVVQGAKYDSASNTITLDAVGPVTISFIDDANGVNIPRTITVCEK